MLSELVDYSNSLCWNQNISTIRPPKNFDRRDLSMRTVKQIAIANLSNKSNAKIYNIWMIIYYSSTSFVADATSLQFCKQRIERCWSRLHKEINNQRHRENSSKITQVDFYNAFLAATRFLKLSPWTFAQLHSVEHDFISVSLKTFNKFCKQNFVYYPDKYFSKVLCLKPKANVCQFFKLLTYVFISWVLVLELVI